MPYIDLNNIDSTIPRDKYDITIIGAGAAGILLAVKLTEIGLKVLVIESGHFIEDEGRQILNEATQTGKLLKNIIWGRKRAVGGTTIAWGGQSLPFSAFDFSHREWMANSGWPINYDDLKDYYPQANTFMGIDSMDYRDDIFNYLKIRKIPFNEDVIQHHFFFLFPEPNFRNLYDKELRKNVTVVYNAVLTKIETELNSKVSSIQIENYQSQIHTLEVKSLILATGTIEAVRTLLLNNINPSDAIGKFFMEHPCITVGSVFSPEQYALQKQFNTHVKNKKKYSVRMSLSEKMQKKFGLLNASAGIMFYYPEDEPDPYIEARNVIKQMRMTFAKNLFPHLRAYMKSVNAYFMDNLIYKHNAKGKLVLMLEQEPLSYSSISLSTEKDMFGLRKANINWKISKKTWDTAVATCEFIQAEFKRLSLGEITLYEQISSDNDSWENELTDVNHHMGGTRMGTTPGNSVVDKDLKVWGYDNLYVCSCSVFPTASHSNPTLTLLALAIRLVDKLAVSK